MENKEILDAVDLENKIFLIRGHRVMVDFHLAELYVIPTKSLNLAVRRNVKRFPSDFMFQLTKDEFQNLRFQFETSSLSHGGSRYLPYVFTEHGVAMLSAVLKSQRAVQMSIFIVRVFVKMRELLTTHKELAQEIDEIERKQKEQGDQISSVYSVVRQLIQAPVKSPKKIGFSSPKDIQT